MLYLASLTWNASNFGNIFYGTFKRNTNKFVILTVLINVLFVFQLDVMININRIIMNRLYISKLNLMLSKLQKPLLQIPPPPLIMQPPPMNHLKLHHHNPRYIIGKTWLVKQIKIFLELSNRLFVCKDE